ncbi:UDP-2,4-diacetamido-2,4,6-trideoxy-beta-L-altropyranose hydrolase [Domibacillus antri]|uniref:UDP-2,4-diacetamido-2,4, 6-trideoxy-beta-L-altropyranose hydrolase n=1 Tax=Domibacillus antri TaxID=1714264 RepID=A0A1Q8Q9K8_9BACI|nr:UDP-2,4-diacetamido-2,4,6-trideoxy-beta-L-altropyranose hydrolase [Domibacillus antri]OLN24029.1 UDP-2,4-diacetamido-2,4,6-trideoxy-beta-L-altropyranose hydrolase [Domibacillus antri]
MNVIIRTDASVEIGTGHVMRCLTLANQFKKNNVNVSFVCRAFTGNLISLIKDQGFAIHVLPAMTDQYHWQWIKENWAKDAQETQRFIHQMDSEVDLLIVDHYELNIKWEEAIRSSVKYIMVMDDLANRPHNCHILLDQNYYLDSEKRYEKLVPHSCMQLIGPNYALLREEFLILDPLKTDRDGTIKNILVFFGGTDPTGETIKALKALHYLNKKDITVNVVLGSSNPRKECIKEFCAKMTNVHYHSQINYMAKLMVQADLAIGAGGSTSWERCYLGLPAITIILADNQKELTEAVTSFGAMYCLGESQNVTPAHIMDKIRELCDHPREVMNMTRKCRELMNPDVLKEQLAVKKIMELCAK